MRFTPRHACFSLLLAAAVAVGACADDASPAGPSRPVNRCTTNADCAEGRCDTATNRCVATARTEVFLAATPAAGRLTASAYPTITQARSLGSGDAVDIHLRAPHSVYGVVATPDPAGVVPRPGQPPTTNRRVAIQATVEFVQTALAGLVEPVQSATTPAAYTGDPNGYTYQVTVIDGTYDVVVRPAADLASVIPPLFERAYDVRSNETQQRFDILYPLEFPVWAGRVTDRMGRPLTGLTVRCVDPARNGALVSTIAHTRDGAADPQRGAFEVRVSPQAPEDWVLRFTSESSDRGFLTVDVPRSALAALGASGRDLRVELPSATGLPGAAGERCVGCITVRGTVAGRATTEGGRSRPAAGASVSFRSVIALAGMPAGARAWFQAHAQTDDDGAFAVDLVPGEYDVLVAPRGQELANAVHRRFQVTAREGQTEQSGQIFELDPLLDVTGRVLTPAGEPVRSARVTAIPFAAAHVRHACLDDADMRDLAPMAAQASTTTAADGTYRLDLDPGLYRFLVEPGAGSGFAPTLHQPPCITGGGIVDITLDAPVAVHGVVRDARGRPQAGAMVEGLIRVREPGAAGVLVRTARSTADASGRYTLLLPGGAAVAP